MKLVYFTKYSKNGASSRLRSYQYIPLLEKEGFEVSVFSLFDENYVNSLEDNKILNLNFFKFYFIRFLELFTVYKYDIVIIEKELFPYFFSWFERIFWLFGVKYIVDYDDAIFHNYDLSKNKIVSILLKNKINTVMKLSNCVLAGNSYLAERAKVAGAQKIIIQPTVIDIDRYKVKTNHKNTKIIIGWIGSPTTFKYVKKIKDIFKELSAKYDLEFQIVGAKNDGAFGKNVKFISWSEENEVTLISQFDIGIMPLENSPWELGKCAYKLIQYMGCALPVVASAVGMNNEVVDNGKNGFLVTTKQEWLEKLSLLIENEILRKQFGKQGRIDIETKYSNKITFQTLLSVIKDGA